MYNSSQLRASNATGALFLVSLCFFYECPSVPPPPQLFSQEHGTPSESLQSRKIVEPKPYLAEAIIYYLDTVPSKCCKNRRYSHRSDSILELMKNTTCTDFQKV